MSGSTGMSEVDVGRDLDEWQYTALGKIRVQAEALRAVEAATETTIVELVYGLRCPGGGDPSSDERPVPWEEIGDALGTTGEAARQRFGKRVKDRYVEEVRDWALAMGAGPKQLAEIVAHEREAEI